MPYDQDVAIAQIAVVIAELAPELREDVSAAIESYTDDLEPSGAPAHLGARCARLLSLHDALTEVDEWPGQLSLPAA
jgi:hypothetical protein